MAREATLGWERRGRGRAYYYRSVREANRVRRVYSGAGQAGARAAALHAAGQAARAERLAAEQRARARIRAPDGDLAAIGAATDALVAAALRAHGFYVHHRQWRRRKQGVDMEAIAPGMQDADDRAAGDLTARARDALARAAAPDDPQLQAAVRAHIEGVRRAVAGPDPSPLEAVLAG